MKLDKVILTLLSVSFLSACQQHRHSAAGNAPKATQTSPIPGTPEAGVSGDRKGPSDGGGGDTCNGKMIESFRVDIVKQEEFREYILPILKNLGHHENDQNKKIQSPLLLTPHLKNWYIIDCKLDEIPKERKGLYMETYQTAIHTEREIFIDATSYHQMKKEEKAKLLLHEMVMSQYLMKYMSLEDFCKRTSCEMSKDLLIASNWKMFRPEPYRPLNTLDHQNIRTVTAWLWSQGEALNPQAFDKIAKQNDFDKRSLFTFSPEEENKHVLIDNEALVRMFKKYQWSKACPQHCQFDSETGSSSSACETAISAEVKDYLWAPKLTIKALVLNIKITRKSDSKVLEGEFALPLAQAQMNFYVSQFTPFFRAAPFMLRAHWPDLITVPAKEGLKSQQLFFLLNLDDPNNPEIFQMHYQTYIWYAFEEKIVEREGFKFKETYGYPVLISEETENLFIEKELPVRSIFFIERKVLISSIATGSENQSKEKQP